MCNLRQPYGLILGDVSIQSQNKGKTYRLKFEWSDINKDYAFHVYDLFKEWILTEPKAQTRINSNGNEVVTWRFQTFSHEAFNENPRASDGGSVLRTRRPGL